MNRSFQKTPGLGSGDGPPGRAQRQGSGHFRDLPRPQTSPCPVWMASREAGGPDTEPPPRMCDGSLRPGEGEPPPAAPPAGRPVEGNERGGGLPWAAPRPAAQDSWGFARAAAAGASGESEAAEGPVGARHLGGCTANAYSGLRPHVPGGIGPTHSRPGVGLRPVSAAGSRCRCSRLTRGSRVTRTPPASPHSAACPRPAVSAPHSYPVPRRCQRPTRRCCSCPAPPPPPRPCTRGDAGEAPTAGRHTLRVAVILKPTPARRPPPPRPPDSAGPTGPLFHWELPISARDGSVLTIQRPQSEVLGFHSHAPDGRCCTPCPVWLTLHPRYLARCLGLAKY